MTDVKIIRLHDGLDIICEHTHISGVNFIKHPMVVYLDYESEQPDLIMQHWIPYELVKDNETSLASHDVLCTFEPTDTLKEFYLLNIEGLKKSIQKRNYMDEHKDDISQTSMEEVLAEFDLVNKTTTKYH